MNPDVYGVEVEAGRTDPLPPWVEGFAVAAKLGIRLRDLPTTSVAEIHAARTMLIAERIVSEERERKHR